MCLVLQDEANTPIKQDTKKGKLRFYPYNINVRPLHLVQTAPLAPVLHSLAYSSLLPSLSHFHSLLRAPSHCICVLCHLRPDSSGPHERLHLT